MKKTLLISRHGTTAPGPRALEEELAELAARVPGLEVLLSPHLYHIPEECSAWGDLAGLGGALAVAAWMHPRPAEWVLRRHGVAAEPLVPLNLAAFESAGECLVAICDALALPEPVAAPVGEAHTLDAPQGVRWYPVVDRSRCTDCQHCLQFCLFGVYSEGEGGQVVITNPDQCKAGCPACSRICPQGAIMFPFYLKDDAIAGAPGSLMAPDAAARKMFYTRTKRTCPVCGSTPDRPGALPEAEPGACCQECGRALIPPAGLNSPADPAYDEIDSLIEDLDRLARRRS